MDTEDLVAAPDNEPEADHPRRRLTDRPAGPGSVIGPGIAIEGELRGAADLEIWGRFTGRLAVAGLLTLRLGSRVAGTLEVADVVVEGELLGDVRASGRVDLRSTCRVEAEIEAARVVAAEGSEVEGRITVTGETGNVTTYSERRLS